MTPTRTLLALSLAIAAIAGSAAPPASAATACPNAGVSASSVAAQAYNDAVLCLLNQQRTANGLTPVVPQAQLTTAALGHSADMKANHYFAHESFNGTSFSDRIAATGYVSGASRWLVGENIAWGSLNLGTPAALMTAWMNSPEHRDNILEPDYREIGVGTVWGTPGNPNLASAAIVTTDFGVVKRGAGKVKATKANKSKHKKKRKRRKRLRSR